MISKEMTVKLSGGMEARPVAILVQVASQYEASVYLDTEDKHVNAKSIMGMMSLGLDTGDELTVVADGADEAKAVDGVVKYLSGQE